jgi:hypothetical protein
VLEFTEAHPLRIGLGGKALRRNGRKLQAELGGTASPSPPRSLVFAAPKALQPASKRPAGGNGLIQKKKKRDEYRATEQDRPVPYIKTEKTSIRRA